VNFPYLIVFYSILTNNHALISLPQQYYHLFTINHTAIYSTITPSLYYQPYYRHLLGHQPYRHPFAINHTAIYVAINYTTECAPRSAVVCVWFCGGVRLKIA
jgi:hypothetical protein